MIESERQYGRARSNKEHIARFFEYWTWSDYVLNGIGAIAAVCAGVTEPLLNIPFGNITTTFSNGGDQSQYPKQTNKEVLFFLYLAGAQFVAIYLYMSLWLSTSERITNRIRKRYLNALLSQDLEFHSTQGAGALVSRIEADLTNIQNGIGEKLPLTIMYIACMVAAYVVALYRSWRLGLVLFPMLPLMLITTLLLARFAIKFTSQATIAQTKQSTIANEALGAIRTAHSLGAESHFINRQCTAVNDAYASLVCRARAEACCMAGINFIIYSGYALAFFYGAQLIRSGNIEPGIVISVILALVIGSFALSQIPSNVQSFASAYSSWKTVNKIIERKPAIISPHNNHKSIKTSNQKGVSTGAAIDFDNVSFAYPSRPSEVIIDNLNFSFERGKTTAIVGHSGSSKSTLALLMERFYDPTQGSIQIDGVDIRDIRLREIRGKLISYVNQGPVLLKGTIFENIVAGLGPDITLDTPNINMTYLRERVEKACKIANAHEFIMQLPKGYFTRTGASGMQLSGGQRARIAIARALVRESPLLILDEATANLDTINEKAIFRAIHESNLNCTTIIIAHRPSAITHADRVLLMSKGKILADGTFDELTRNNSSGFAKMFGSVESETKTFDDPSTQAVMEDEEDFSSAKSSFESDVHEGPELPSNMSGSTLRESSGDDLEKAFQREQITTKEEINPKAEVKGVWRFFFKLLLTSWRRVSLGLLGCLGTGFIFPAFAVAYGQAFDTFTFNRQDAHQANLSALYFFIIAIGGASTVFLQYYCVGTASTGLTADLRKRLFKNLLTKKPIPFFDNDKENSTGALLSALNTAPDALEKVAGIPLATLISSVLTLTIGCIVSLAFNWKYALVNMAALPITLLTGVARLKIVDKRASRISKAFEPSVSIVAEAVTNIQTIASLAREEHICKNFDASLATVDRYVYKMAIVDTSLFALSQTNLFFVIALGFWYGSLLLSRNELTQREFFTVFIAIISASFQCVNLVAQSPEFSRAKSGLLSIMRLIKDDEEDDDREEKTDKEDLALGQDSCEKTADTFEGDLKMDHISFRYPNRKEAAALQDVSFEVHERCHIGLCGPSGSGKSSSIALIERFYQPNSGTITLGNKMIESFKLNDYRQAISLVTQEPVLFSETILENLYLGLGKMERSTVSEEDIRDALKDANLLDTVEALPEGLHTDLGEKGAKLSGGQRQRLVIARALLRKPRLLLLDEASSALDWESQKLVQQSLQTAMKTSKGRMTISVAHRLETLKECDQIYVIDKGQINQQGTYTELMHSKNGIFAKMVRAQQK